MRLLDAVKEGGRFDDTLVFFGVDEGIGDYGAFAVFRGEVNRADGGAGFCADGGALFGDCGRLGLLVVDTIRKCAD